MITGTAPPVVPDTGALTASATVAPLLGEATDSVISDTVAAVSEGVIAGAVTGNREVTITYPRVAPRASRRRVAESTSPNGGRRVRWEVLALDLGAVLLAVTAILTFRAPRWSSASPADYASAAAMLLLWPVGFALAHCYRAVAFDDRLLDRRVVTAISHVLAITATLYALTPLAPTSGVVPALLAGCAACVLGARAVARRALRDWRRRAGTLPRVVLAADAATVTAACHRLAELVPGDVTVLPAPVSAAGSESDVRSILAAVAEQDPAVLAIDVGALEPAPLRTLLWSMERSRTQVVLLPRLIGVDLARLEPTSLGGVAMLQVVPPSRSGVRGVLKEAAERVAAAAALMALSPVLVVIGALVKLTSAGPALFVQTRVGRDGRAFPMLKFRSMYADAESQRAALADLNDAADGLLFKIRSDPRVTALGRMLRRFSLDELPQLWNVVVGDMALVGPRPPLPEEVAEYDEVLRRRLLVKPGLTGLWQVSGRSDLSWDETVRLDLHYVDNWSLAGDLVIVGRTVGAVLRSAGAY